MTEENRINEIEIMLVHQEQKIDELSSVVEKQWKEIDALKAMLRITEGKIEELEMAANDGGTVPAANVKPPHY